MRCVCVCPCNYVSHILLYTLYVKTEAQASIPEILDVVNVITGTKWPDPSPDSSLLACEEVGYGENRQILVTTAGMFAEPISFLVHIFLCN